jgi:predicted nucleotidyltransferase
VIVDTSSRITDRHMTTTTIPAYIERHRSDIENACREAGVKSLWLFGSATRPDYQPGRSDVDFLVELAQDRSPAAQFFQLYRTLAELFDERIDLVSIAGVKNQFFKAELTETRIPLYVAA